jgi:hypothetical protein
MAKGRDDPHLANAWALRRWRCCTGVRDVFRPLPRWSASAGGCTELPM